VSVNPLSAGVSYVRLTLSYPTPNFNYGQSSAVVNCLKEAAYDATATPAGVVPEGVASEPNADNDDLRRLISRLRKSIEHKDIGLMSAHTAVSLQLKSKSSQKVLTKFKPSSKTVLNTKQKFSYMLKVKRYRSEYSY